MAIAPVCNYPRVPRMCISRLEMTPLWVPLVNCYENSLK